MSLHLLAESSALRLYSDASQQWLFAQWHGAPTLAERREGYKLLLAGLATNPCRKLLNDSSELPGCLEWPQAARQLRRQFWRRAAALGVQLIADVLPPYSPAATESPVSGRLSVAPFEDVAAACTWLLHHPTLPSTTVSRSPLTTSTTTRRPSPFQFHFSTPRRVLSSSSPAPLALVGPTLI